MGFYVPWVVNGSKHSARLFRRALQQNVGTGSGVSRPEDLKVLPLSVPGTGFRVLPGSGVAQSRDTDTSGRESYGPVLEQELTVSNVPGTGSGEVRRDLVIVEITDPEMKSNAYPRPADDEEGWQDGDNFCRVTVIPNVNALVPAAQRPVKSLEQIKTGPWANVTGVTLAAINWPASTGTITGAMIEDLRKLQSPKSFRSQIVMFPTGAGTSGRAMPTGGYGSWPFEAGERPMFDVPEWATRVIVTCWVQGVEFRKGSSATDYTYAGMRTVFAATAPGENTIVKERPAGDLTRTIVGVTGVHQIQADIRGTKQYLNVQAYRSSGGTTGNWWVDRESTVLIDYEFTGGI